MTITSENAFINIRTLSHDELLEIQALTGIQSFGDYSKPILWFNHNTFVLDLEPIAQFLEQVDFEIFKEIHFGF